MRVTPPFWLQVTRAARDAGQLRSRPPFFTYASVVSTLALILSGGAFYFSYFHVRHSLNVVAAPSVSFSVKVESFPVIADLVFLNDGNRTETVLRAEPQLYRSTANASSTYTDLRLRQGPWVLKPGDAVPMHLEWRLTPSDLRFPSTPIVTPDANVVQAHVVVNIVAVGQDGTTITTPVRLGLLEYQKNIGEFRFTRDPDLDREPIQPLLRRPGA